MHLTNELKGGSICHRVDENIAVDTDGETRGDHGVFVLAGGVDDVALVFLSIVFDRLGEGVLDSGEVVLGEVVLNELDDEGGFACWRNEGELCVDEVMMRQELLLTD